MQAVKDIVYVSVSRAATPSGVDGVLRGLGR
jgi:hypothetical protein